ncbi:hypothetical protein KCP76_20770 [Salmonella enterica subsp. enterica serovar Weltevreden]|nr:hypothetical protein KCP76_20770 [Salmonella enterica subsp. enterica serovar Weltevreden]
MPQTRPFAFRRNTTKIALMMVPASQQNAIIYKRTLAPSPTVRFPFYPSQHEK